MRPIKYIRTALAQYIIYNADLYYILSNFQTKNYKKKSKRKKFRKVHHFYQSCKHHTSHLSWLVMGQKETSF